MNTLNPGIIKRIYQVLCPNPEEGSDKGGSDKWGSDKGGSDKGGSDKGGSDSSSPGTPICEQFAFI
jgi:hypothetical protein